MSDTVLALTDVVYSIPSTRTLTLTNTGAVAATWRFVPKPEDRTFGRSWLSIHPPYGMLVPGQSVDVSITANVDDAVARDISLGRETALHTPASVIAAAGGLASKPSASALTSASGPAPLARAGGLLEDILILRLERGRDYYISVVASVLPTCFGATLEQLARRPEPMRAVGLTAAAGAAANAAAGAPIGGIPSATLAAVRAQSGGGGGGGSAGSASGGSAAIGPTVDLAAGSAALAALLARDDGDEEPSSSSSGNDHVPLLGELLLGPTSGAVPSSSAVTSSSSISSSSTESLPLSSSDVTKKGTTLLSIPKEIWRLVDALWQRGLGSTRGIFTAPTSDPGALIELRECLDTGDPFPPGVDPLALAQTLLDLLTSLREPVIPTSLFPGPDFKSLPLEPWVGHMLRSLSALHYNVLVYLVRFGREVLAASAGASAAGGNGATLEDLALVMSRACMRKWSHEEAPAHAPLPGAKEGSSSSSSVASGGAKGAAAGVFEGADGAASAAGGGNDDAEGGSAAVGLLSLSPYADKGTRWEPSPGEQEAMTRIFTYLLSPGGRLVP